MLQGSRSPGDRCKARLTLFRLNYSSSDHDLLLFDLDGFLVLQPYLDQGGFFGNELWLLSLRGMAAFLPRSKPGVFWHEVLARPSMS